MITLSFGKIRKHLTISGESHSTKTGTSFIAFKFCFGALLIIKHFIENLKRHDLSQCLNSMMIKCIHKTHKRNTVYRCT